MMSLGCSGRAGLDSLPCKPPVVAIVITTLPGLVRLGFIVPSLYTKADCRSSFWSLPIQRVITATSSPNFSGVSARSLRSIGCNHEQHLTILHQCSIFGADFSNGPAPFSVYRGEQFHHFDDANGITFL